MLSKLLKNSFYNSAAGIVRIALSLFTIPLLLQTLGIKEYGVWTLVTAIIELIALSGNNISVTVSIFASQDLSKKNFEDELSKTLSTITLFVFIYATLSSIFLWTYSESIINFVGQIGSEQKLLLVKAIQIGSLISWIRLLQQILVGVEHAHQKYGYFNAVNTIQYVVLGLGFCIIAWHGGHTYQLIVWQLLIHIFVFIAHLCIAKILITDLQIKILWELNKFIQITQHSIISWIICLGSVFFGRGDRLIIASLLGSENLGVYAAITDATSAMSNLAALPVHPIIPHLSNYANDRDYSKEKLKVQIQQTFAANTFITIISAIWLFALAPQVMKFLLGDILNDNHILAFKVAVFIYALNALNAVGFCVLLSIAVNWVMIIQLFGSIFTLFLIAFGSIRLGLLGAVIGNSGFLVTWIMLHLSMKRLKLKRFFWIECLSLPLLCFLIYIFATLFTPNSFNYSITLAMIATFFLGYIYVSQLSLNFASTSEKY
jgi:O-antigen/teichoic acid export membrane protein